MKSLSKKISAVTVAMLMSVSMSCITASANTITRSVIVSGNVFKFPWEKTKTWNNGKDKIIYGYSKKGEDYCMTFQKDYSHIAHVTNRSGNIHIEPVTYRLGNTNTTYAPAGKWTSKAIIKHKLSTVQYNFIYDFGVHIC